MRLLQLVLLAGVFFVSRVHAQTEATPESTVPFVNACVKEVDVAPLRDCVTQLARYVGLIDGVNVAERKLIASCLQDKNGDDLKECLKSFSVPDKARAQRADELEGATRTWEVIKAQSRMNDTETIVLRVEADDEVSGSMGARYRPVLWLRCRENTTSVVVQAEWFLDDNVPVTYRIDKDKPVAQTWGRSDNYKSAGLWDGSRAIPFIKAMLGKQTLLARVTPRSEGPKEMAFNIAGLEAVIDPLRKACKW